MLTPDLGAVVHRSPKTEAAAEGVHGEH